GRRFAEYLAQISAAAHGLSPLHRSRALYTGVPGSRIAAVAGAYFSGARGDLAPGASDYDCACDDARRAGRPLARHGSIQTIVLVAFGASAILLAMLGIYGVLAYSLATRRREIGVRIALGATQARIYWLTVHDAGHALAVGIVIGLIGGIVSQTT